MDDILDICKVSVHAWFAASKPELDMLYEKFCVESSLEFAERLKTGDPRKLGDINQMWKLGRNKHGLKSISPYRNYYLAAEVKYCAIKDVKVLNAEVA